MSTGVSAGLVGCRHFTDPSTHVVLDFATETGALNYCYALLQLETDFYTRVFTYKYVGMLLSENTAFHTFMVDTTSQQATLRSLVPAGRITDGIEFRLGQMINFSDRSTVLSAAQVIADPVADGYLGAAQYITTTSAVDFVTSVATSAAQRAATVQEMVDGTSFTPTSLTPDVVMARLQSYYLTTFTLEHV
jgi:hypothetical protein